MINFDKEEKEILSSIKKGMQEAVDYLEVKVKEKTPEDTYELINNYKQDITQTKTKTKGELYNNTEYAQYVEYGVGRPYNYYKGSGRRKGKAPFYIGVGARMMTRTIDNEEEKVYNIIKNRI